MNLSEEQSKFVEIAQKGKNILVDACIGSGKTTAIQALCKELPRDKKILYLTYNKLLKIDAKSKIHEKNVLVTNYHGQVYGCAPTEIIYRICLSYILGFSEEIHIKKNNIKLCDTLQYTKNGTLQEKLNELFVDRNEE